MRIRSIRPEFYTSEDIAALDWHHRLVYIGLWSYVDDNGVGRDVERLIVTDLFPLDESLSESSLRVHGALKALEAGGQITRYRVNGKPYLHITAWEQHQKINRPTAGRYPLPTSGDAEIHAPLTEPSVSPHAKAPLGEGEKGRRGEEEKGGTRKRAHALPDDWAPTDAHRALAAERGVDCDLEASKMRDWATAEGKTGKDWNARFRLWLNSARPERGSQQRPNRDAASARGLVQAHEDLFGRTT